jgi:hypothetical protein
MNILNKNIGLIMVVITGMIIYSCSSGRPEIMESNSAMEDTTYISEQPLAPSDLKLEEVTIDEENIGAFEKRGIQKLQDLADYLSLLADTTIDITFKEQAKSMALDLFASTQKTIQFKTINQKETQIQKPGILFNSIIKGYYGSFKIVLENIQIDKTLISAGDNKYSGSFIFLITIIDNKKQVITKYKMQCAIEILKIHKTFGEESKRVWEVFLGDIEII